MISALRRAAARPQAIQRPRRNFSVFDWWRENVIKPIHGTRIKLPDVLGVPAGTSVEICSMAWCHAIIDIGPVILGPLDDANLIHLLLCAQAATYMQFVYPVPVVVGGYYVMQWAIGRSHASIGPRGERLRDRPGFRPDAGADEQRAQLQRILDEARRRKAGD